MSVGGGVTMTRYDDVPCARSEVRAGTQLTTSYLPSSLPRLARRHQLHHTWGFWCRQGAVSRAGNEPS